MQLNRKRNFSEATLSLRNSEEHCQKERKPIKILERKEIIENNSTQKEEFNEKTIDLINAFKMQYQSDSNSTQCNEKNDTSFKVNKTISNPFLNQAIAVNSEAPKTGNPFLTAVDNSSMPNWNFNFNVMKNRHPAFEEENENEEDDGAYEDPEIEQEIKPTNQTCNLPIVNIKYESEKYANCNIEQLSLYDFEEKKYKEKGNGSLSLELFRGKPNKGVIVFRQNHGLPILFQGNVIPDITTIEKSKKSNSLIALINKVVTPEGKQKVNAIKIKFASFVNQDSFIDDFNNFMEEIKGSGKEKETSIVHNVAESKKQDEAEINSKSKLQSLKPSSEPITKSNSPLKNPFLEHLKKRTAQSVNSDQSTQPLWINSVKEGNQLVQKQIKEVNSNYNPKESNQYNSVNCQLNIQTNNENQKNKGSGIHISHLTLKPKSNL